MKFTQEIKKDFSTIVISLIPIAVGINIVIGQLVVALKLPVFLDSIGTILIAMLAGPWVGMSTGLISNLINGAIDPTFLPFTIVSVTIGGVTGFFAEKKMFTQPISLVCASIMLSFAGAIVAAPVAAWVFGGITNSGNTIITTVLLSTGKNLLQSVFTSQIIADLSDKLISILIAVAIIKAMPDRYLVKFKLGLFYIKQKDK